jgi:hypothetical protein
VAEQTALQVGTKLALDKARHHALALVCASEVSLELVSNDRVGRRHFGRAPCVHRRLRAVRDARRERKHGFRDCQNGATAPR